MLVIFFRAVILLGLIMVSTTGGAKNWDDIFEHSVYQNAKISPDGKHLAVSVFKENEMMIAFLKTETLEAISLTKIPENLEVGQYYWVNNERVVINVVTRDPWVEQPISYGELYALNIDGSKGKMIYGDRSGEKQTGSKIKKNESTRGWGEIIDILLEDKNHILISSTPMSEKFDNLASVLKLNVYTGVIKKKIAKSPVPFAKFLTDSKGQLKLVVGEDRNDDKKVFIKQKDNSRC